MFKKSKTARRIQAYEWAAMRLTQLILLGLARWAFETVDVRRRVQLSRRQQAVGTLAAVGVVTAGLVAKRAIHGSDAPAPPD